MTAKEVCEALNISRQTLYAYVSRGKVRASAQKSDARKSLYHTHDVDALIANKKRGRSRRAIAKSTQNFGEPVLKSEISHIDQGKLYYKGQDAIKLSQTKTFEDIAKLLINVDLEPDVDQKFDLIKGRNSFERMFAATAEITISKNTPPNKNTNSFIIKRLLAAICNTNTLSDEPIHMQLAKYFSDSIDFIDVTRRCLVLCADHELNPSAYTARIAASTDARTPACILAALSTFSGTKHGSMTSMARWWVGRATMKDDHQEAAFIKTIKSPPGFGHPIYAQTDPRTQELLKHFEIPEGWERISRHVSKTYKIYPNLDFSLAAMEKSFKLRPKTGQTLFAFGRLLGWIAHAEEQRKNGALIRPRSWN
ncbi:citrate/2-methylcitrate synthase [Lentilitoribacter sp. EG35]|uniref:citrate/2-methylcitrate synthase n=1 Tax=Lentilitoribacter sp. EG35 TaxID=3234192 RepID=UPI003460490F